MTDNYTKPKLKSRYGANLSLNYMNLSLGNRHSQATKHSLNGKINFSVVTPVITHFFMKQAVTIQSSNTLRAHLSVSREHSLISIANHLLTNYDGLALQNKRAERRIFRSVCVKTESKTRHPISLLYSVAFTQNLTGAIHHG